MERDKIVEQLNEVNRKLNQGDKCNPQHVKDFWIEARAEALKLLIT